MKEFNMPTVYTRSISPSILVAILAYGLTGCAARHLQLAAPACIHSKEELRESWRMLQDLRAEEAACPGEKAAVCEGLRLRIESIEQTCPQLLEAQLASAILAFERRQLQKAQAILDTMLAASPGDPDAALLRARIAIDEGNLPFALRFLAKQIQLVGNHPGLRETYASALYLSGELAEARNQLDYARKLGAAEWRIEYDLGLIAESEKDWSSARVHYRKSQRLRPDWSLPRGRLKTLDAVSPE